MISGVFHLADALAAPDPVGNGHTLGKNLKPLIFYGLHMAPGVAEYREPGQKPFRVLINEEVIREMGKTFPGCPVFVNHIEGDVDYAELRKNPPDGYVMESFFNRADGKHWTKFIVTTPKAVEAIAMKWRLSNAYVVKNSRAGMGQWHGVDYDKEVTAGEYEHLAIVKTPRYGESMILSPEEFKQYNEQKEAELLRLANSNDEGDSQMKFWKKQKVEKLENATAADIEAICLELPKTKKEVTIGDLIKNADMAPGDCYANGDHKVKVGEEEMTVNDLVKKHLELKQAAAAPAEEEEEEQEDAPVENEEEEEEAAAEGDKDLEKRKNELDAREADLKKREAALKGKANFNKLANAGREQSTEKAAVVETTTDMVARGKALF